MIGGYVGKIAEVDVSNNRITSLELSAEILKQYIGGRGLATKILWDRLGHQWSKVDPLGPENILLAFTGPLTGYLGGARVCVSGKSPLTNGIVGSTASGEFAIELKCAGFDGIIVKGASKSPIYILVTDNKIDICKATKFWGLNGIETVVGIMNGLVQ